jgi:drug/metabolite transporter (DMT)-like permease
MTDRPPISALALIAMVVFFWGINFPAIKVTVAEVPVLTFRAACLFLGGATLLAIGRAGGAKLGFPTALLPRLLVVSALNVAGWHIFVAWGLSLVEAGRAVIVGYTMPIWAALASAWLLGTRLTHRFLAALALGVAALALLIAPGVVRLGETPVGALLVLVGAISWGVGTTVAKRWSWPMPTTIFVGWQLILAFVPIAIGALLFDPSVAWGTVSTTGWIGLIYALSIPMVFCHWAYFHLLTLLPAHVTALSVIATPVVGVGGAALLLGEPFGWVEAGALALVLASMILTHGGRHRTSPPADEPERAKP